LKHKRNRQILGEGKYIRLVREGTWEYAERTLALGAVAVVAVTDDDKLVLIEQYREPIHNRIIELPAGLVGDIAGESVDDWGEIARRELLEETGFAARRIAKLAEGPVSAGFSSELVAFYLARGLKRVGPGGGVDHEEIEVHTVPLKRVFAWLKRRARAGCAIDQKIYAGLYFAALRNR
jgi:ADP-ribose pyrophosphatase